MEKKELECIICMLAPIDPVVTQCGHVFCWKCLHSWVTEGKSSICPICRNGIDLENVISLYTNNNSSRNETEKDKASKPRPVNKRVTPLVNNTFGFSSVFNLFYNSNSSSPSTYSHTYTDAEIQTNRLSLFFLLLTLIFFYAIYAF